MWDGEQTECSLSASSHYPILVGGMPKTKSHWRDILLSWKIGSDVNVCASRNGWLRTLSKKWNGWQPRKRPVSTQGKLAVWLLCVRDAPVIEMIAKPALPNMVWWYSLQTMCNALGLDWRLTRRWSDYSLQCPIKLNHSLLVFELMCLSEQRLLQCRAVMRSKASENRSNST